MLGNNCRFSPSCSEYAVQCLKVHYLPVAILKGIWRVFRCNPWNAGGYDPVKPLEQLRKKEGSALHG